jgi:agmatine deiminase
MPAEEAEHQRTWMCWPSSQRIWGPDLVDVQDAVTAIARAIRDFEPVTMLARPEESGRVRRLLDGVTVVPAPVDDLWARDTLPSFLVRKAPDGSTDLAAGRVRFNGWGDKQVHSGDAALAQVVADHLGVELIESGLVGEGGGLEVDGHGTVLAAQSSWVNPNRNPGLSRQEIEAALLSLLGADRMIWVDGLAGQDITDGHIDTLARFASEATIVIDAAAAAADPGDPWAGVAARTREQVGLARTNTGQPYMLVEMTPPTAGRRNDADFLATYMNYYVCNGAVIAPQFGDRPADARARDLLGRLFPGREVVQLDIDPIAAGGGGIHCATQQQPVTRNQ